MISELLLVSMQDRETGHGRNDFKGFIISIGLSGSYILYRSWDFNVMCENVFEFDGGLTCTCQEFDLGCGVSMPLT